MLFQLLAALSIKGLDVPLSCDLVSPDGRIHELHFPSPLLVGLANVACRSETQAEALITMNRLVIFSLTL